nr:reverse transcriptase domain-containing protein [Tanacetum cinerariifolium]
MWRNKADLVTMSMDDLCNNLKVYEPEVKGMSSSSSSTQNMNFVSSSNNNTSSTNSAVNTTQAVNTAHEVSTAGTQEGSLLLMAMRLLVLISPKWSDTTATRGDILLGTLVSCDSFGGYSWSDQAEEGPNFALMAFSSSSSDSEGNPQMDLQDQEVIYSGRSRYMTGNMFYLTDYEEIDGGYVSFGRNSKEGKITGKGKLIGNPDEGFVVGYSLNSKAFRVFNSRERIVEENLHIRFSESTPNLVGTQSNGFAGTKASDNADPKSYHDDRSKPSSDDGKKVDEDPRKESECNDHEKEDNVNSTNNANTVGNVNTVSSTVNAASTNEVNTVGGKISIELPFDLKMPALEDISYLTSQVMMKMMDLKIQTFLIEYTRLKKHCMDYIKLLELEVKIASTSMQTQKPLLKDEDGKEVDVHMYRSMIGSLMYLTSSRPDIMFIVCACARYQVNPKFLHLHAVKRIFRVMSSPNHHTSNIEDAFSSNFPIPASPDYVRASLGKTYSSSSNNSFSLVPIALSSLSLFHDDPYMKVMHAYYAKELPIPPPTIVPPALIMPPKRTSTSEAPVMNLAAIRQLVADSITAAIEAQAANMANADNTNRNLNQEKLMIEEAYKLSWVESKKLLIKKYCLWTEVHKMENKFYHLTVKGNDIKTYVRRFQELETLCPTMVSTSEKMMEAFIGGLP